MARYQHLPIWRSRIADFLTTELGLRLRDSAPPRPVGAGLDFLGFIVRPRYRLVRRRIVCRCWSMLASFERQHRPQRSDWRIGPEAMERLRARLSSWLGHFRHADAGRLWQRLCARFDWLAGLFLRPESALREGLRPRWRLPRPAAGRDLRQQLAGFARLRQQGWQRDGRRQRVVFRLFQPAAGPTQYPIT